MVSVEINQRGRGLAREALSVVLGALFTLALFASIAGFEFTEPAEPALEIEDFRAVAVPIEAPPPKPAETTQVAEAPAPVAGIEVGPSESAVKISVAPPELGSLMPPTEVAPVATIQTTQLYTNFKPKVDVASDFQRIFQESEVDKIPTILFRPNPDIPRVVRRGAAVLRITMLIVVDANGVPASVRILKPSGNSDFDEIIVRGVQEDWSFTPAIKKGRKVKCLLQQAVAVTWKEGTRLEL